MDAEETQSREIPTDYVAYLNQRTSPEDVQLEGVSVEIFPGVFRPATDAHLLAAHLGPYLRASESKAPSVLDTTSGSGILSAIAAAHGATGIALDINPTAVENSNHNFELKGIGFRALQSDAFKALTADATFDLILATPPYLDGPIENPLDYAVHGTTHFLQEFLSGARAHLNASGKVLITYAEWGLLSQFEDLLAANKWSSKIIDSRASADGARVYRLYELS